MKLSLQQYSRYFFVGSVVGVSAVILRELVAFLAEDSNRKINLTLSN